MSVPALPGRPELVAHVPLCELVMACLQNPTDRPQTALELRKAAGVDLEAVGDLDALLLDGLAQDYGKSHGRDAAIRKYFNTWPREAIRIPFRTMASEPISPREWGALRYLDQAGIAQGLNLVERYVTALKFSDCDVRAQAARRLRQLGSLAALEPLEKQAATPGCGQEEAMEAARALRRRGGQ